MPGLIMGLGPTSIIASKRVSGASNGEVASSAAASASSRADRFFFTAGFPATTLTVVASPEYFIGLSLTAAFCAAEGERR
jgi:hypothetical protein